MRLMRWWRGLPPPEASRALPIMQIRDETSTTAAALGKTRIGPGETRSVL